MSNEHLDGHLQNAWQNQDVPPFRMSLEEIRYRIKRFDWEIRVRNVSFCAFHVFLMAFAALLFFLFPNIIQRIGSIQITVNAGFIIYQIRLKQMQKESAGIIAARMGHAGSVDFYRTSLQRELEFYCGVWSWSRMLTLAPGLLLFMLGPFIDHPNKTAIYLAIFWLLSVIAGIYGNLWMSRKLRREIGELEKLQSDQPRTSPFLRLLDRCRTCMGSLVFIR